jgi:hypothetical protein
MNPPVLLAAVLGTFPVLALAQESAAQSAPHQPACLAKAEARGARGALPARAGTAPEPQRGTVAPGTRVPSNMVTPSSRAMAAALARDEKTTDEEKNAGDLCARTIAPDTKGNGGAQSIDR